MSDITTEWKSVPVFEVGGMTLKTGKFRSNDGTEVELSPEVIEKIFSKADQPVPFYFTHANAGQTERYSLGFAYKYGLDRESHKMEYKAFAYDQSLLEKYAIQGFDATSAEVDLIKGPDGAYVDGTLTGIALTNLPGIDGTDISISSKLFSRKNELDTQQTGDSMIKLFSADKAGVEKFLLEKGFSPEDVTSLWGAMKTVSDSETQRVLFEAESKAQGAESKVAELESKVVEATKKVESLQAKASEYEKKYNDALDEKLQATVNEIKSLGVKEPEKIVDGLPNEQKIAMLSKIKENLVIDKPSTTPPPSTQDTQKATPKAAMIEVLEEMGLTQEYEKYKGK